ncbi:MAG: ATPase, T2SS/T4P/T4SS family [Planctomycetota bacterium]|nr:ATPase, T2SS/T4P/T4SS family [Planctomycetota bacterium]MDI6787208.1 ATPase, T2SS/T4P/T4SS family [Planctomycetota bacterium]
MKNGLDKKVSALLLKENLISADKNQDIISQSIKGSLSYIETLISNNVISEENLLSLVAIDSNIPPVNLEKIQPVDNLVLAVDRERLESYNILPVDKIGNIVTVAVSNPYDIVRLDEMKMFFNSDIRVVLSTAGKIKDKLAQVYNPSEKDMEELLDQSLSEDAEGVEISRIDKGDNISASELVKSAGDAPIVKFVNKVIYKALEEKASDMHIEPFEKSVSIRYRKDGVLHEAMSPPKKIYNAIVSRIKIMTSLDIAERRIPQDGKFQIKYQGRQIDFRVSTLPTIFGEKVVMRVLDSSSITMGLDVLGFEPEALAAFRRAISTPYGMLLVTGPTGSGKSTTLYSALKEIMSVEENLMTVEDPVEYQLEGIGQVPISPKRGFTFALALRSILRQDPNKVMVGEIRDGETADIAVKAAMTGHLVLSTLHTNDAASSITRLVDMGVDRFLVASSVILIAAQRLARKLCEHCKKPMEKLPDIKRLVEIGFKEDEGSKAPIYHPVGCAKCNKGYKGRFALLETLEIDDEIRRMVIKGSSVIDIKKYAVESRGGGTGMITLRRCGLLNIIRGRTSIEEVLRMTEL